jgi:hypothetical protein
MAVSARTIRTHSCDIKKIAVSPIDSQISVIAIALCFALMLPSFLHARSVDPNLGCSKSQFSAFGELLEKHHRARIMKIVVGRSGTKAPITPIETSNTPEAK